MSAHGLFAKALREIAGRDLGNDHKALAKRVQELFTARNAVAHRGMALPRTEAEDHVRTAVDAIAFLRALTDAAPEQAPTD